MVAGGLWVVAPSAVFGADVSAPTQPGVVTVSSVTASTAVLKWGGSTDNVGVTGYQVWRATSASGPFSLIATTTLLSYANGSLSTGTTRYYQVTATDAAGNVSLPTPYLAADTLAPLAPTNLAVSADGVTLGGSGEAGELFVDGTADPEPEPVPEPSPPVHRPGPVPTAPEDDHFVPPEPPPLPRLGPPAVVGLVLLVLGLVLVSTPAWVGVPPVYGLPLGLLSLASGLGWLVLRLWPSPPDDDGPGGDDDGAVI
jgi:hypothetical protein